MARIGGDPMTSGFVFAGAGTPVPTLTLTADYVSLADISELTGAIRALPTGTGALIVRSAGPDFCLGRSAGHGSPPSNADEARRTIITPIIELFAALTHAPFPVLAAVRGRAAGFGFTLAAGCDVLLAAETATFALPEIEAGIPPLLALVRLAPVIPRHLAFHLATTGATVTARQLQVAGVAAGVLPDDTVESAAQEAAGLLAARPQAREVKAFLRCWGEAAHIGDDFAAGRLSPLLAGP